MLGIVGVLLDDALQFAEVMGVAERVAGVGVAAVGPEAVVHGDTGEVRQHRCVIEAVKATLVVQRVERVALSDGGRSDMLDELVALLSDILSAGAQGDDIMVWALCQPEAKPVERLLWVVPTGQPRPEQFVGGTFVGTVQMHNALVFHVFDGGEA